MAKPKPAGNSTKQPIGRPFAPGVSGNPSGRPKGRMRLVRELLDLGDEAIANLKVALKAKERWATERVVDALMQKEAVLAALLESDGDELVALDWTKIPDADMAKVISIAKKAQAK